MKSIKIYGERNTGTSYLSQLIKKNIKCKILLSRIPFLLQKFQKLIPKNNEYFRDLYFDFDKRCLGWKHTYINDEILDQINNYKEDLVIVTVTKNPYSWLISMFNRPYHFNYDNINTKSFEEFLNNKWRCVKRENSPKDYIKNPIELWNMKNNSYLSLSDKTERQIIHIKYENILADYKKVIKKIVKTGGFPYEHKKTTNIIKSAKGDNKKFSDYKEYYLNESWKEKITKEQFDLINNHINQTLMEKFNYSYINE